MNSKSISLEGEWSLRSTDGQFNVPAQVPGDTHSALLEAGRIKDPYWGRNELELQHLHALDWSFSRTFEVSPEVLEFPSVLLCCDSIDTVARIRINGQEVGRTANAFRRYRFEVKDALAAGENRIEVAVRAPEMAALEEAKKLAYPVPHNFAPVQSPHRNLLRKPQCHAGWDWGLCLMVCGIVGGIRLEPTRVARIDAVYTEQTHEGPEGVLLKVFCEYTAVDDGKVGLRLNFNGESIAEELDLAAGEGVLERSFRIADPELWWPNGYGEQPLYELKVSLDGDCLERRIGLRELKTVYEEDADGLSLKFVVNGVSLFAKGANWIPADALPQRATDGVLIDLLESAAAVHMNMIRVWGGGQYERDAFYDACDRLGLMVWHDFMFACSLYPATPEFLANVSEEVRYQVKRLRDHTSIALWCGNNENVGALNWFAESKRNRDRYIIDYDRLNEGAVGRAARENDPTRVFWPSSPCGGPGDYSDCWHDDSRGDMHYWSVWHEGHSFDSYYRIKPRFCSEFGYQSLPSLEVIRTYASEEDFNVTSPVMEHHQRSPKGNRVITEMFTRYFRVPEGFANFVYLSQVQQGIAIKTGVEYWRRLQPVCMGALYWQLNDNWPVCSWSSINYGGKWKLLHHMARRFFADTLMAAIPAGDRVEVWVIRDTPGTEKVRARYAVLGFDGGVIASEEKTLEVSGQTPQKVWDLEPASLLADPETGFMVLELESAAGVFRNEHFFCAPKKCRLQRAAITARVTGESEEGFTVAVEAKAPAFYVALEAESIRGEFDDNAFTLLPGETKALTFRLKAERCSREHFEQALTVCDLRSTYR